MRPSDGRFSLWPAAISMFFVVIVMVSVKPTMKLRADPPADFLALHASANPKVSFAKDYWDVAVHVTQWKYNRTATLPEQVPGDFMLPEDMDKPLTVEVRAIRVAYWEKLREEWLRPENWRTSYSIDITWFTSGCQTAWHELGKLF